MSSMTIVGRRCAPRRFVAIAALALVVALGTVIGASAGTARAAVSLSNGASASTSIACSTSMQWVRSNVAMKPQQGFGSQSVSWRQYVYSYTTGEQGWTKWTNAVAPFNTVYVTNLSGQKIKIYMQYAWWNGSAWSYAGEWINSYTQTYGASSWQQSYCAT
jgi:hypothetical protein